MTNTKLMIKKHSAMIQTNVGNLTLTQRKAINFLIYVAQKTGNQKTYQTSLANIKQVCNLASTENIAVKEQLKALTKTTIEFNYLDKDKQNIWEITTLLAGCRIVANTGVVEFAFSPFLLEKILYPEMYAPLNIILISGLKCSYAVVLYEFLRDYLTAPSVPMMTIENFRNILGVSESEYKLFQNFKVKVLNPATEEVNLKTDISCRYELIKEKGVRNKYSHIRFFVSKKTGNITYEKNEDIKNNVADPNMDLFESVVVPFNQIAVKIPEDILSTVPDTQQTEAVKELITRFLEKGKDFIVSNVKYSLKKAKENFPAYLKQAFEKDYAQHQREVKEKVINKESVKKHKEIEKEKDKQKSLEVEALVEALPRKEYVKLWKEAEKELLKLHPNNPFFKRESVVIAKMVELYISRHDVKAYSGTDND